MNVFLNNLPKKRKGRHIQVFSDGCDQCQKHILNVEVGKCAGCILEIHNINEIEITQEKIKYYRITTHPTTIIDEIIRVDGMPNFYWQCGNEFYDNLRKNYPLNL